MATDKNRINAYVDDQAFKAFLEYCQEWNCSQSKGIELLIKQFLITNNLPSNTVSNVHSFTLPDHVLTQSDLEKAITPFEKKLADFDKGFQELGFTVHDHERLLSQPLATKDELYNAIATLKTEIEDLRNTFNSSQTESVDDDIESSQGLTKASLEPILNDDGVSVAVLASNLNMTRQSLEERRDKGTLEELGYTAKKEGKRWKYYPINEI